MGAEWISIASVTVAFGSLLYSSRSFRTAQQSLAVASVIGQVNYENARTARAPAATLVLTEVEHRSAVARDLDGIVGAFARKWADDFDAGGLEVVARGRLVNCCAHELLLTMHDHPRSRRKVWFSHRNQSVFLLDGTEITLGRAVLPAEAEVSFEWIDRRSRDEWINLYELDNPGDDSSSPLAQRMSWRRYLRGIVNLELFALVRRLRGARSGFYLVCESRASERVATIWHAAVVAPPVKILGKDAETRRTEYGESLRAISGPIDDNVIRYRVTFDTVLARLHAPHWRMLRGRN